MSETKFLEEFNSAGNIFNHWVFAVLTIGSMIVFVFAIGLSIIKDSVNNERHQLMSVSMIVLVFASITYMFLSVHLEHNVIDRYTKNLKVKEVTVESINYGTYVEFSYKDGDELVNKKVDKFYVDYVRDLKKGEKVRVEFKEIDIKTIKHDEAPNGLYDVKIHVDDDFKDE